jgi:hypothetical protein
MSKNMADYTNFDGRTNKKIVQAPGGTSTFSIGWDAPTTSYEPARNTKNKNGLSSYDRQPQDSIYGKVGEPIKVMRMEQY